MFDSHATVTTDLDQCLVSRFGEAAIPEIKELEIDKLSKIADLVKELRRLKYAPKIKLAGGSIGNVTARYQAGYSGTESQDTGTKAYEYAESIFIECGGQFVTHQAIREELKSIKKSKLVFYAFSNIEDIAKKIYAVEEEDFKFKEGLIASFEKEIEFSKLTGDQEDLFIFKVTNKMAPVINNWENYLDTILEDDFESLFPKNEDALSQVMASRILTIWLIAESFRYPPMMFYSLLFLHLFLNGQLSEMELSEELHPSEGKTEKAQYYCYLRETERLKKREKRNLCPNNNEYLKAKESQYNRRIGEIEKRKLSLLRKVRDGIYINFQKLKYPPEKLLRFTNVVFKKCIQRYLTLCVGEEALNESKPDLDALVKNLSDVNSSSSR